jgi:multidrug efflux pump subunit AcrB
MIVKRSIEILQEALKTLDGISQVGDTAQLGIPEVKIGLNLYGESLGLTESSIANQLSPYYLYTDRAKIYDTKGVVRRFFKDAQKDDASSLENFELTLNNGKRVYLKDVVTLTTLQNYENLHKVRGIGVKTVFANVNNVNITSKEALILLEPIFKELKRGGVQISLRGEQEESLRTMNELTTALVLSIGLIFLTLLLMFGSFKNVFIILSIIPLSVLGGVLGHLIMGINLSLPSFIGMLGLAGVVINDAIIMLDIIRKGTSVEEIIKRAASRLRPVIITSLTTFIGLSTLIFFATGQAKILQPIAISLGFGLIWGTLLTLFFLPGMYLMIHTRQSKKHTKSTLKNFKINEIKKENL